jgi:demethylmenaquinone methyltransferase/2-methoxy-6-polyprenyl-1,4-benzoquinol methylase
MAERTYVESLRLASRLTRPAITQAMDALALPSGSAGLDVGCGIGQQTRWLAERIGPQGRVTGLDLSPEHLAAARESRLPENVELVEGDIKRLPFEDRTFDWVWCADTLWPVVISDPVAVVRGLARVIRPGGSLTLVYWSGETLLPGFPRLEARLAHMFAQTTHYLSGTEEQHSMRALHWMTEVGLEQGRAESYLAELRAPLSPELRESLAYCLSMLWGELELHVPDEDWETFRRLSDPDGPEFIGDRADYYGFATYTAFTARVPR